MKGHLRRRGNAWELRAYVDIDPITKRQKYLTRTFVLTDAAHVFSRDPDGGRP
jgi:hypothetical protein